MAIISCPECGKEISDRARACPHCGTPISDKETTIEKTSKRYKGQQLGGCLLSIVGVIIAAGGSETGGTIGGVMIVIGLVLFLASRFGAWWHHG